MNKLVLNADNIARVITNDRLRDLLPCVAIHPKDVAERAKEECGGCQHRARQLKAGRELQLKVIAAAVLKCMAGSGKDQEIKEILGADQVVIFADGVRSVL